MVRGSAFANVVAAGLYCVIAAPKEATWKGGAAAALEPLGREAVALAGLLADDRSGIYEVLVEARAQAGDAASAQAIARDWLAFLEAEQARAPTAEARAVFDPHVMMAARKAGEPARALGPLLRSEKDLPDDYNAPARLAFVYKDLGRLDEARAASARALAKVYGPRRVRLLANHAEILEAAGDRAGARAALTEALRLAETLPASKRRDEIIAGLRGKLTAAKP
jgi:tetratricopeptide (TPR) repeat protein